MDRMPGPAAPLITFPGKRERDFAPDLQGPSNLCGSEPRLDVSPGLAAWPGRFEDRPAGRVGQQSPHRDVRSRAENTVPLTLGPGIRGKRAEDPGLSLLDDILAEQRKPEPAAQSPGQSGLPGSGETVNQDDNPRRIHQASLVPAIGSRRLR